MLMNLKLVNLFVETNGTSLLHIKGNIGGAESAQEVGSIPVVLDI